MADLKGSWSSLRALDLNLLEMLARAQAAGSTTMLFSTETVAGMGQVITRAVMDIESVIGPAPGTQDANGAAKTATAGFDEQVKKLVEDAQQRVLDSISKAGQAPASPVPG